MNGYKIVLLKAIFMLYKLPECERVCSGICKSEPPRLVSQGKSYTVKELNNEGYNPPLKTEVEVLCKVDHSTLVRGPKGYQFLVPEGGLEPVVKDLDELHGVMQDRVGNIYRQQFAS